MSARPSPPRPAPSSAVVPLPPGWSLRSPPRPEPPPPFLEPEAARQHRQLAAVASQEDGPQGLMVLCMPGRVVAVDG